MRQWICIEPGLFVLKGRRVRIQFDRGPHVFTLMYEGKDGGAFRSLDRAKAAVADFDAGLGAPGRAC